MTFIERTGTNNRFNGFDVGDYSIPTLADIDGDGDFDAIVGNQSGTLSYYRNTGSANNPFYVAQTGGNNPFNGLTVFRGFSTAPTFADIDGDGDLDAIVGERYGRLFYYRNTGSAINPVYTAQGGSNNPFGGIDVGDFSRPAFADIDSDGDLDAIVGQSNGNLNYFKNTGTVINPVYVEQTGSNSPFHGIDVGFSSPPALADLDGDCDLDLVVGKSDGTLNQYRNDTLPKRFFFTPASNNPFNGVVFPLSPSLIDLDSDGDLDAMVGRLDGIVDYYRNTGSATNPIYATGFANPLIGLDVGNDNIPTFVDLDGDGDLDAVIGEYGGILNYSPNVGSATAPAYTRLEFVTNNPFAGIDVGASSSPTFADLDGDLDLVVGERLSNTLN